MALVKCTISVVHRQGLHARPAALFVQAAKHYKSRVTLKKGRKIVDGKSIMGLLTLAARKGSRISIVASGSDAARVVERLAALLTTPLPVTSTVKKTASP